MGAELPGTVNMLNSLQGLQQECLRAVQTGADTATGRHAVSDAWFCAPWSAPDIPASSLENYWQELFGAVCARLTALAQHSTQPTIQAGVSECVAALSQLGNCVADQRAQQQQQADEFAAL
jgi:hypothetical protein